MMRFTYCDVPGSPCLSKTGVLSLPGAPSGLLETPPCRHATIYIHLFQLHPFCNNCNYFFTILKYYEVSQTKLWYSPKIPLSPLRRTFQCRKSFYSFYSFNFSNILATGISDISLHGFINYAEQ